jgi:hypothetical protein
MRPEGHERRGRSLFFPKPARPRYNRAEVIRRRCEGIEVMARIHLPPEGEAGPGDVVEVILTGPANATLLDSTNYEHYRRGESFEYHGGLAKDSPFPITPPHPGRWHLVVDLGG